MMRIFLAEQDPELRVGLQFLINRQPGFQVIGIAVKGNDLLSQLKASEPDVIILDWNLPGKPIEDLLVGIRALDLELKIISLSIQPDDEVEAMKMGVDAIANKSAPPMKLIELMCNITSKAT